jgi:hypothetical protein
MAAAPPALAMIARRRVAEHLIETGATSADSAVTYQPGRRLRRKGLSYLTRRGIVTLTQDGRYWIDEAKYREWHGKVRKRVAIAVGGALAAAAAVFAFTR